MKYLNKVLLSSVVVIVLVMSVGYSVLNKELSITGEVNYRPQGDMRITNVKQEDISNANIEYFDFSRKEIKLAYSSSGNAFLKFTVEVTNYSNTEMGILKIDGLDGGVVEGYTFGEKLVGEDNNSKAGMTKEFTITYNSSEVETKSLLLKFDFEEVFTINYEGFDNTQDFKKEILNNDKLVQNLGDDPPRKIEVTMNDKVITPNYSNGTLTINQVTGNIKVKSLFYDDSGANEPVLSDGMIPVYYDENDKEWKKADRYNRNNNWCDYNNQKWCNAVTVKNVVRDLSGNGNDGEIHGAVVNDGKAYFDGVDDYIDAGLKKYDFKQVTYVAKFTLHSYSNTNQTIMGNTDTGGLSLSFLPKTNKLLTFGLYNLNTGSYVYLSSSSSEIELEKEYVAVGTYDGNSIKLYLNGVLVAENNTQINFKTSNSNTLICSEPQGDTDFSEMSNATINDALIFDKALSEAEIKQHYSNEVTLGETKPLVYYNFEETSRTPYVHGSVGTAIPIEEINTMWVWIPRYSYTIKSEDGGDNYFGKASSDNSNPSQALPGEIDIRFISQTSKDTGSARYIGSDINGWFTPPGFKFGDKDLSGVWIGKFEVAGSLAKDSQACKNERCYVSKVTIKPNVASIRSQTVSSFFYMARSFQKADSGYNEAVFDLHMAKNEEWSLISYLTQSKYGKYGNDNYTGANKEVYQNKSSDFITGNSNWTPSQDESTTDQYSYNDMTNLNDGRGFAGPGASTTGNIYGIYDISGGANEYVMGVLEYDEQGNDTHSGMIVSNTSNFIGLNKEGTETGTLALPASKYYKVYKSINPTSANRVSAETACDGGICYGHAFTETAEWYGDYPYFLSRTYPWLQRGGYNSYGKVAGIFYSHYQSGGLDARATTRLVLTP